MLNAAAKAYNEMPKPKSKTQKRKAEEAKNKKINYVACEKCKRRDTTLYKYGTDYYCKEHLPEE